ncbi:MAG: MBL fold metallo-hydrolase [bacterium]|nr:MBL fold metallo-hydrolase [bacterium]MDE0351540.1 MBL fold metallo-hydrolase [bacterium]
MSRLHVIGAGTPTPTPQRFGTAFVVDTGSDLVMFDCGPAATHKLVKAGLWPTRIDHLFFTHHHFDHDADYPCFLLCRWDQSIGRENTLKVRGPTLTAGITEGLIGEDGVFAHDWKARVRTPVSQRVFVNRGGVLPRPAPVVDAADIGPGSVIEGPDWLVRSAEAVHVQPFHDSLAYRIETPTASIVVTGDTQPCDSVVALATGATALVSMCWDHEDAMEECGEAPGQTGTKGAARMAREAEVGKLILVHRGPGLEGEESEARARSDVEGIYDGEVILADELDVIDI